MILGKAQEVEEAMAVLLQEFEAFLVSLGSQCDRQTGTCPQLGGAEDQT